jgi:intraflagellar transport protein 52
MTRPAVSACERSSGGGLNGFSGGRLVAVGSGHMFADKYIDQEANEKFRELLFDFLTNSHSVRFAPSDHDDIDVSPPPRRCRLDSRPFERTDRRQR